METLQPQLRFSEFEGPWILKELKEFLVEHRGGAPLKPSDFTTLAGYEVIPKKGITSGGILKLDIETPTYCTKKFYNKYKKSVIDDSFLITTLRDLVPSGPSIGYIVQNKESKSYILAQGVYGLKINKDVLSEKFLIQYSNTIKYRKLMQTIMVGSTQVHIRNSTFFEIKIPFTTHIEQQKIAKFLTTVDTKISQLTRKKELLEKYKKGVMQQIFNQEIRFKDNKGNDYPNWVEKKLEDFILDFIVPMRDKPKKLTGDIPWCRIEDFEGKYLLKSKSNQGVSLDTVKKMNLKVYPINTLLVSCSANLGFCAIVKKELITNQTFIGLFPDLKKINVDFLFHTMKLSSRRLNVLSSGTTISYLSRKQFEQFKIPYPCPDEQTKIAIFLSAIDDKINHVTTQLEKTTIFKKGLLQKMFI